MFEPLGVKITGASVRYYPVEVARFGASVRYFPAAVVKFGNSLTGSAIGGHLFSAILVSRICISLWREINWLESVWASPTRRRLLTSSAEKVVLKN